MGWGDQCHILNAEVNTVGQNKTKKVAGGWEVYRRGESARLMSELPRNTNDIS